MALFRAYLILLLHWISAKPARMAVVVSLLLAWLVGPIYAAVLIATAYFSWKFLTNDSSPTSI